MTTCKFASLADRTLLRISGPDAPRLLQGILTCDVEALAIGEAAFGALLTPQGKVLFDFFLIRSTDSHLADIDASLAGDFKKRLEFYRLRAKVAIEPMDVRTGIHAAWDGDPGIVDGIKVIDPRSPAMGLRLYCRRPPTVEPGNYHEHRISVGMPQGGLDFVYGDVFPHEVLMDQFGGVDFAKGCYVGQEVVSRMQHRGTARNRMLIVEAAQTLPPFGTEILAGGKTAGSMGSSAGRRGLALVRIDRIKHALDAGEPILAGSLPVRPRIPDFASFDWPRD